MLTIQPKIYTKNTEIYSPPLCGKVNRSVMLNILKQSGIILRIYGKESTSKATSSVPTVLYLDNGETTTNPYDLLLLRALIITLHLQLKLQKIA